jgi:hypothetical protein
VALGAGLVEHQKKKNVSAAPPKVFGGKTSLFGRFSLFLKHLPGSLP